MELLNDFQTSVRKAFDEIDPHWESYDGLVICGTHSPHDQDWEKQLEKIKEARETNKPTLGICFGLQLMAIEYARNVLGIKDAVSEEFNQKGQFVVVKLPTLNVGLLDGESWWNNYAVLGGVFSVDNKWDVEYWHVGSDYAKRATLDNHPHFRGVQFHPEYQSSKEKPHPLLVNFLYVCSGNVGGRRH